ncbi:MAG: LytR C-terminal domain-containing protein [Myxococcaceae bacterium]|nr:LytR C-terminal domain-containing protein [Myxococcaceae bacterium]
MRPLIATLAVLCSALASAQDAGVLLIEWPADAPRFREPKDSFFYRSEDSFGFHQEGSVIAWCSVKAPCQVDTTPPVEKWIESSASETPSLPNKRASVVVRPGKDPGRWSGRTWTAPPTTLELSVCEGSWCKQPVVVSGRLDPRVRVFWSGGLKRVAWLLQPPGREPRPARVVIMNARFPQAQVLADASTQGAVPAVTRALSPGYVSVKSTGVAKKARETSVVYARSFDLEEARRIAALVPGGASVEELTWATEAEFVIALGASVLGGQP